MPTSTKITPDARSVRASVIRLNQHMTGVGNKRKLAERFNNDCRQVLSKIDRGSAMNTDAELNKWYDEEELDTRIDEIGNFVLNFDKQPKTNAFGERV